MKLWAKAKLSALAGTLFLTTCDPNTRNEYFSARPDPRLCISPVCGGFWFKRLNQPLTRCFDGTEQAECYAGEINFRALNLTDAELEYARSRAGAGRLVLKGRFVAGSWPGFEYVASFTAQEAWDAATDQQPKGTYFWAHEEPIVCVTYPCPNITGTKLNVPDATALYTGVDLTPSGATQTQIEKALVRLANEGLILAADIVPGETGPAGQASALSAWQFYVKLIGSGTSTGQPCGSKGLPACSNDQYCQFSDAACGQDDRPGTCETRPEVCPHIYDPVCGCDGKTYGNDCERRSAGVGFAVPGPCSAP